MTRGAAEDVPKCHLFLTSHLLLKLVISLGAAYKTQLLIQEQRSTPRIPFIRTAAYKDEGHDVRWQHRPLSDRDAGPVTDVLEMETVPMDRRVRFEDDAGPKTSILSTNDGKMEKKEPVYLPDEIIIHILGFICNQSSTIQQTLATCCLLSHQWYNAAVSLLYQHPNLSSKNFNPFVSTICPSKNVHVKRSPRAEYVLCKLMARSPLQDSNTVAPASKTVLHFRRSVEIEILANPF